MTTLTPALHVIKFLFNIPQQPAIVKRTIHPYSQPTYEEQSFSSSSSSQINHGHILHQPPKHHQAAYDSDDDDLYNHNTSKRHKYETDV